MGVRWSTVCKLARHLPEVEEGRTYGAPALRVRGSLMARLLDDKRSMVLKVDVRERAVHCASRPDAFHVPPGEEGFSTMVVDLRSVDRDQLRPLLENAWRHSAPPSVVARHAAGPSPGPA